MCHLSTKFRADQSSPVVLHNPANKQMNEQTDVDINNLLDVGK